MPYAEVDGDDLLLHCHIQPKAARSEITGLHGGRLKIRISAPPSDGKANAELLAFIARRLGVPKSRVALLRGASSRQKTLKITGCNELPPDFPPPTEMV